MRRNCEFWYFGSWQRRFLVPCLAVQICFELLNTISKYQFVGTVMMLYHPDQKHGRMMSRWYHFAQLQIDIIMTSSLQPVSELRIHIRTWNKSFSIKAVCSLFYFNLKKGQFLKFCIFNTLLTDFTTGKDQSRFVNTPRAPHTRARGIDPETSARRTPFCTFGTTLRNKELHTKTLFCCWKG